MKLIFVAGSWGSGTTAVIGALNSLGVPTLGPHFTSNDPNTKNTFELITFRDLVHQYVDDRTLKFKDNYRDGFMPALEQFRIQVENIRQPDQPDNRIQLFALKMPLASMCLAEICATFETRIIVVHRPLEEIEASRLRRKWPPRYGSTGAQFIYSNIFNNLFQCKLSFLGVSYGDFVNNTRQSLDKIIEYCDINDLQKNLGDAEAFVESP